MCSNKKLNILCNLKPMENNSEDEDDTYLLLPAVIIAQEKLHRRRMKGMKYIWSPRISNATDQKMYKKNKEHSTQVRNHLMSREYHANRIEEKRRKSYENTVSMGLR